MTNEQSTAVAIGIGVFLTFWVRYWLRRGGREKKKETDFSKAVTRFSTATGLAATTSPESDPMNEEIGSRVLRFEGPETLSLEDKALNEDIACDLLKRGDTIGAWDLFLLIYGQDYKSRVKTLIIKGLANPTESQLLEMGITKDIQPSKERPYSEQEELKV
jgi:hypothetical protein